MEIVCVTECVWKENQLFLERVGYPQVIELIMTVIGLKIVSINLLS